MCESFRQYNIDAINVLVCPIRVWLKKLLDFNTNDIISLINIKYDNSITDRIFIILNYFIFYHNIKKIGAKVVIIDGLLPLRMFNQNVKVISFIRSTPQCIAFTNPNLRINFFLNQLRKSITLVSASNDCLLNWQEFDGLASKKTFNLMLPIDFKSSHTKSVDSFL